MPKKKKALLITGIVLGVIILIIGIFCILQRDNISAFLDSRKYSSEELAFRLDEDKSEIQNLLSAYLPDDLRDLTAEEEFQLIRGDITLEQARKMMGLEKQAAGNGLPAGSSGKDAAAVITKYTSQLYAIKAQYLSEIGAIAQAALNEFYALPESERTASVKASIVSKYYSQAASLESGCDTKVSSALNSMEGALGEIGANTDVVSRLQSQYEQEKSNMKAYYLGQM